MCGAGSRELSPLCLALSAVFSFFLVFRLPEPLSSSSHDLGVLLSCRMQKGFGISFQGRGEWFLGQMG